MPIASANSAIPPSAALPVLTDIDQSSSKWRGYTGADNEC